MKQPYFTANGQLEKLEDFNVNFIDLNDIAIGLGNMCRFNGQCDKFYSVAEHSLLVADLIKHIFNKGVKIEFAGLLHDASEAYLHDMIRPVQEFIDRNTARKCTVDWDVNFLHHRIMKFVGQKFSFVLTPGEWNIICQADNLALDIEGTLFFPNRWNVDENRDYKTYHESIKYYLPEEAKKRFLRRFENVHSRYVEERRMASGASSKEVP